VLHRLAQLVQDAEQMQTDDDDKRHTGKPKNYVAGHLITPSVDLAPETNWNVAGPNT
jgi:hypothetical protein